MMDTRKYVPLSADAQAERRPPPVGVLLSGIDGPIKTNEEPVVRKTVRRVKPA